MYCKSSGYYEKLLYSPNILTGGRTFGHLLRTVEINIQTISEGVDSETHPFCVQDISIFLRTYYLLIYFFGNETLLPVTLRPLK